MNQEALRLRLEAAYRAADTRTRIAADLAMLWIKSLLIVNGGAIIGLTTLVAKNPLTDLQKIHVAWAVAGFAASALITLAALMVGYIGQANMIEADERVAQAHFERAWKGQEPAEVTSTLAKSWLAGVMLAGLSLGALAVGIYNATIAVLA